MLNSIFDVQGAQPRNTHLPSRILPTSDFPSPSAFLLIEKIAGSLIRACFYTARGCRWKRAGLNQLVDRQIGLETSDATGWFTGRACSEGESATATYGQCACGEPAAPRQRDKIRRRRAVSGVSSRPPSVGDRECDRRGRAPLRTQPWNISRIRNVRVGLSGDLFGVP